MRRVVYPKNPISMEQALGRVEVAAPALYMARIGARIAYRVHMSIAPKPHCSCGINVLRLILESKLCWKPYPALSQ